MRLLLEAGTIRDPQEMHCKTALMYAAREGHVEIEQFLLEARAGKELQIPEWADEESQN